MSKLTNILLLFFAIFLTLSSFAQNSPITSRHEVSFSLGIMNRVYCPKGSCNRGIFSDCGHTNPQFSDNDYQELFCIKYDEQIYPSFSLNYTYRITNRLSIGSTFSYAGNSHDEVDRMTGKILRNGYSHNFTLTPMVRFSYLKNRIVHLYGEAGIGLGLNRFNMSDYGQEHASNGQNRWIMSYQVTPFGISIGRKFFGFSELGVGDKGFFIIGAGYKFNSQK